MHIHTFCHFSFRPDFEFRRNRHFISFSCDQWNTSEIISTCNTPSSALLMFLASCARLAFGTWKSVQVWILGTEGRCKIGFWAWKWLRRKPGHEALNYRLFFSYTCFSRYCEFGLFVTDIKCVRRAYQQVIIHKLFGASWVSFVYAFIYFLTFYTNFQRTWWRTRLEG